MYDPSDGPTLLDEAGGARVRLRPRTRVGRSRHSDLRLDDPSVSGEHALIEWRDGRWVVRDLGSRNGTRVDGEFIPSGGERAVDEGAVFEFAQEGRVWVLVDARGPDALTARAIDRTLLTRTAERPVGLDQVVFRFVVSSDEETVGWSVRAGGQTYDLGERAHGYLVLTLARLRRDDAHLPEADRGWTYADELARRLGTTPETLKVQVYRARRQLQGLLLGATSVIERRAATNQIRFGADAIEIV